MVWFLNHFMVVGATNKKNPNIFDVAGANFYFTISLYIAILVVSIIELTKYPRKEKAKKESEEISFEECIIKDEEKLENEIIEKKGNLA